MTDHEQRNSSFLLEIGTEDLPARFLPLAIRQMEENTARILQELHVPFSSIRTYGTPRRLTVIVRGLPARQEYRVREVFGPARTVAFDESGRPTKAATGFARSLGVEVESLVIKRKDKGEYVVAVLREGGAPLADILPDVIARIVLSLSFPKTMRWADGDLRFARPIRWLLALFDGETVSVEIDGIRSGNSTKGHRFLSPAPFTLLEISGYRSMLENNFVIVDQDERKTMIRERMANLLQPYGETPIRDDELLETVVHLVEYPVPVVATFPREYLDLPRELLITVMKGHQKYFAVENSAGTVTNRFVVVSNTGEENADTVRIGAERVIRARFEDARFYFEEDRKVALHERVEKLRNVAYHERLGSLYAKTERVAKIAAYLSDRLPTVSRQKIVRAAWLAKADLITGVVREFPELQGTMGKYYALASGEDPDVAQAIEEHYLPAYSGGPLPRTDIGALLSIADKIDSITAFFSVGLRPTGSEDPFALRRQALGIVAILLDRRIDVSLQGIVDAALETLPQSGEHPELKRQILEFFEQRLEVVFPELGYRLDSVHAVLRSAYGVPLAAIRDRLDALERFRNHDSFVPFVTAVKRVHNIVPKSALPSIDPHLLVEDEERSLMRRFEAVSAEFETALGEGRPYDALVAISALTEPIDRFFDNILVMDKREEIKQNRLTLLQRIWDTVSRFADFSKLS